MERLLLAAVVCCAVGRALRPPGRFETALHMRPLPNSTTLLVRYEVQAPAYNAKDVQLGCKELRSKKYISDGLCTSVKPITEVVCAGVCLPVAELPWYTDVVQHRHSAEWRCVNDISRKKRVHLVCQNGTKRSYRIRVVRSCKCKKYQKVHNRT